MQSACPYGPQAPSSGVSDRSLNASGRSPKPSRPSRAVPVSCPRSRLPYGLHRQMKQRRAAGPPFHRPSGHAGHPNRCGHCPASMHIPTVRPATQLDRSEGCRDPPTPTALASEDQEPEPHLLQVSWVDMTNKDQQGSAGKGPTFLGNCARCHGARVRRHCNPLNSNCCLNSGPLCLTKEMENKRP